MKKATIILGSIIGLLIILGVTPIIDIVCAFLFAGIVPGTDIVLPFWAMSLILATIATIAINWLFKQSLFIGDDPYRQSLAREQARATIKSSRTRKQTSLTSTRHTRKRYRTATTGASN